MSSNLILEFSKQIDINPNDVSLYYSRGSEKMKIKDYAGAIEDYNRAIEFDVVDAELYYNRGNCKYFLGDNDGANLDWRKANELGLAEAYRNLKGNFAYKTKQG